MSVLEICQAFTQEPQGCKPLCKDPVRVRLTANEVHSTLAQDKIESFWHGADVELDDRLDHIWRIHAEQQKSSSSHVGYE